MREIIIKATEGGYDASNFYQRDGNKLSASDALLDPFFWQALGRAMGWEGTRVVKNQYGGMESQYMIDAWAYHWHRFIDHLAEGKDTESFFTALLAHKE